MTPDLFTIRERKINHVKREKTKRLAKVNGVGEQYFRPMMSKEWRQPLTYLMHHPYLEGTYEIVSMPLS